ncbi:MAG: hypothetical protein ACN6OP_00710 [Pseudomonadales bacterium]
MSASTETSNSYGTNPKIAFVKHLATRLTLTVLLRNYMNAVRWSAR